MRDSRHSRQFRKKANSSSQETGMSDDFSAIHPVSSSAATGDAAQLRTDDQALLESLSALMDDQADELELRRILKAMPGNVEFQAKWKRFHTVRSSLRQEMHPNPAVNLLEGINARLGNEGVALPGHNQFSNPVLRYVAQGVIAASFFAITIMATSVFNQSGTDAQSTVADATTNLDTPVLGGEYKATELSRTASLANELDEEALAQLRQAVDQQFSDAPAAPEIPVSYTFELPVTDSPAP
jgi:negative regulator of sigma E activity